MGGAAPLLPSAKPGGRPRSSDLRRILDAICYVVRSGCAWRLLPGDFAPGSTGYDYFRKWRSAGVWQRLNAALREQVRRLAGRQANPARRSLTATGSRPPSAAGRGAMAAFAAGRAPSLEEAIAEALDEMAVEGKTAPAGAASRGEV